MCFVRGLQQLDVPGALVGVIRTCLAGLAKFSLFVVKEIALAMLC